MQFKFSTYSHLLSFKYHHDRHRTFNGNLKNIPPPRSSKRHNSRSLYILVLDDGEYRPEHYHCLAKKLWMDKLRNLEFIDGVEIYSLNHWRNSECGLKSVAVEAPRVNLIDGSTWLLYNSLKLFLNRSNAGFLYLVGDGAYLSVDKFTSFFESSINGTNGQNDRFLLGNCIEQRYFFKMHTIEGGMLMSRQTVTSIIGITYKWETSMILGFPADDTLGQIVDQAGYNQQKKDTSFILGREWHRPEQNNILLKKEFHKLQKCEIPPTHLVSVAGELSNCNLEITPLNKVAAWAEGGGEDENYNPSQSKTWFLENVEKMLENLPDNIGFYWDLRFPMLCKIEN